MVAFRRTPGRRGPSAMATAATAMTAVSSLWMGGALAASAGDYYVHSLPGAPDGPLLKMHAGHIEVTPEHNGNLFFWHFANKHIADKQRTVIWLNGGPGCSSEDGAMMELGPYRMKDAGSLKYNEGGWNEFANLMFVDNPVGTGFSYVNTDSYIHELYEMADQFLVFLEKWFELFPEYEHDDLYIAGESYAGQHIPYIAKSILDRNKNATTKHPWNLKGLLIGNGWISPPEQYEAYLDYAYDRGIVTKDSDIGKQLENQRRLCLKDLTTNGPDSISTSSCEAILQDILLLTKGDKGDDTDCVNMYDVRLRDSYPSCGMNWPPDLVNLQPYLRREDVIGALHINPNKNTGWSECSGAVNSAFRAAHSKPSVTLLPDILAEVPVVLFSGADDLICNHLGTEALIGNMQWNNGKGFELTPGTWAPRRAWHFEGEEIGFWQEARNLSYVLFHNSSHMVPFDHPRRTLDMINRVMGVDVSQSSGSAVSKDSHVDGEDGSPDSGGGAKGGSGNGSGSGSSAKEDAAKWKAYRKSGEVVLVIVAVAAAVWGWWVWRERRRARHAGYQGVSTADADLPPSIQLRRRNHPADRQRDLEAGVDTDSPSDEAETILGAQPHYSVGSDSEEDDEEDAKTKAGNGRAGRNGAKGGDGDDDDEATSTKP